MPPVTLRRARRALWLLGHLALGALIAFGWLAPLAAAGARRARIERQRRVRWWMVRLLRGLGVQTGARGPAPRAPVLLVANHVSWLDIPCLLACADTVFVAKAEIARWPLIGALAARAGTLFLERGHGAGEIAARIAAVLAAGENVLVFPEGTSTDGRTVRPFHARLLQAARTAGVAVQAVAIRYPHAAGTHPAVPFIGDDSFVPHLWRLLGESRVDAELSFCPSLPAANRDRRTLAQQSHEQIARFLATALPQPVNIHPSSVLQAPVTPAGEHAGPRHPETRTWRSPETPASPAPGA